MDDIKRLNAIVAKKTTATLEGKRIGRSRGKIQDDLPVEIAAVRDGAVVYHRRFRIIVYGTMVFTLLGMVFASPSYYALLAWASFFFFYSDFYSGILHLNLDNEKFIKVPGIDAGCLEFQWHHTIPNDIVQKEYVEVVGDLNGATVFHFVFIFGFLKYFLQWSFSLPVAWMIISLKAFYGYVGQYSHRMCHMPKGKRGPVTQWLQARGLLLEPDTHAAHHATYDDAFPILNGSSSRLVSMCLKTVPSDVFWLVFFFALTMFDVVALTYLHMWLVA